ncbi:transmembrane and coiled-coil domains-containing protein 7 [Dissophora globulifera]|nr:transmembrane and coiled-coil domains-containing protein 7 [Dissophora globulifera]
MEPDLEIDTGLPVTMQQISPMIAAAVEDDKDTSNPINRDLAHSSVQTLEKALKSKLRMVFALVGERVDMQNVDPVIRQRLLDLATLRSMESDQETEVDISAPSQGKIGLSSDDRLTSDSEFDLTTPNTESQPQSSQHDVRTEFVLESVKLLLNDPTNDKELLGLMDQRMIYTMLEIIVCWGIYPRLLPGIGVPLNRRVRSNIIQTDIYSFNAKNTTDTPVDPAQSAYILWTIVEPLARITVAYSSNERTRFTILGNILASRHTPDLYASLLQLAYQALPISKDAPSVRLPETRATAPAIVSDAPQRAAKITPGNLLFKTSRLPTGDDVIPTQKQTTLRQTAPQPSLQQTATQQAKAFGDKDNLVRSQLLQLKEDSSKLFHDLFWSTEAARSLESLTMLLSASSPMHPTPTWFKSVSGRFLSQILLCPGGVRVVLEYMLGGAETVKLDQLEKVARLVSSVPEQMSSVQEYYRYVCPELLEILNMNLRVANPDQEHSSAGLKSRVTPPSPQLVQTATFVVGRLLTKNPVICQVEIIARSVEPLWKWGTRASRRAPVAADTVPYTADRKTSILEEMDEDSDRRNSDLDPLVASEYDVTRSVMFLHSFLVGNEPSPPLFQAFLAQAVLGLYQLYEFLTQTRSVMRETVKEILVIYLRILDPSETLEVLKSIVMRRRQPVPTSKPWQNLVAHDGRKIADLVEMGSFGECFFAPGPTGGAVLRRRRVSDRNAATQLELDVDIFLDFLGDLDAAGREGEVLGDLYMYLLDEYQAKKSHDANDVSPRRMLTILQLILSMTQKLGPSIMSKVTQIIQLANNILDHRLSADTDLPDGNDEDAEEAEIEILGLVLTLLSAILTENEHLSQQDRHLLSLTLLHLKQLSDHPLIEIRRVAHDLQTLIPSRLTDNSTSGETNTAQKTEMEVEMEKYASALAALQDSLLPVRAHGLHILREMILAKSIVFMRSTRDSGAERELDHALDIFVQHVQEPDSFIYLNAVKGLAALTDAHGPEILKKLMRIYANEDGKQTLDTRLRIGEALVQTVQRCGEALGGYLDALLPRLYKVMNTAVDKGVLEARNEERQKLVEKAKALRASEALLTPQERQRKWKTQQKRRKNTMLDPQDAHQRDGGSEGDEEEEDAIMDEAAVLRSSALTILATAAESSPMALLPEMRFLVDWMLSILDLDQQTEVRRAATLVLVLLFRALGGNTLYRIEGDQLKRAYRTLRYVEQVDDDPLSRMQARAGIADLDAIVRIEMRSDNSGAHRSATLRSGSLTGPVSTLTL